MKKAYISIALLSAILASCGGPTPGNDVSGSNDKDVTWERTQSETAVNVSNVPYQQQIITVTYNDETGTEGTILYTPTTRTVRAGASLLGWSYSRDGGNHWTHGSKVAPPSGWAALWGDPAITMDNMDQRYVFISNIAIPDSKMPPGGIDGVVNDYLGGACIARSEDGGMTFKIQQCVDNNHDFYDGSSMIAAGGNDDRRVFASFVDVDKHQIDVWAAPNDTGAFKMLPNPFPGMQMDSHPRLRFDPDTGSLYVAAIDSRDTQVYINRYQNSWANPVVASMNMVGNPYIQLSDRKLRTGYQFSFDLGSASMTEADDIRFAYTAWDNQSKRFYIRGTYCSFNLKGGCHDAPEWGTTPGNFNLSGDQFNPNVRAFRGFLGIAPVWKLTYMTREESPNGNTISFRQGNLSVLPDGTRFFLPFPLQAGQLACPDLRTTTGGGGYWGDYDELQFAGFPSQSTTAQFMLAFTDSSKGCLSRWEFTSRHVHVSAVLFQ